VDAENTAISLDHDGTQKFLNAKIEESVFLEGAGQRAFFREAGLSFGASVQLTQLAKTITDAGNMSKFYLNDP
jgi:hypothetical protein